MLHFFRFFCFMSTIKFKSLLFVSLMGLFASNNSVAGDIESSVFGEIGRTYHIDPHLLYAVALQESNRKSDRRFYVRPHPFTLNSAGRSYYFSDYDAAEKKLLELLKTNKSVDIGIMQINSYWLIVKNPKVGSLLLKLYDLTEKTGVVIVGLSTLSSLVESKVSVSLMKQIAASGMLNVTFLSSNVVIVQKKDVKWKQHDGYAETALANVTVLADSIETDGDLPTKEPASLEDSSVAQTQEDEDAELARLMEEDNHQKKKN